MQVLWSYLSRLSLQVFSVVNAALRFVTSNFVLKPSNSFLLLLAFGVSALFFALTSVLDFELFGSKFTFGSDLETGLMMTIEAGWSGIIALLRSYHPSSPLGYPLEIILESLAGLLFLIGKATPFALNAVGSLFSLLLIFGVLSLLELTAWLYVVGAGITVYQRFFSSAGD